MATPSVKFARALIAVGGAVVLSLNCGCQVVPPEALPVAARPPQDGRPFVWAGEEYKRDTWGSTLRSGAITEAQSADGGARVSSRTPPQPAFISARSVSEAGLATLADPGLEGTNSTLASPQLPPPSAGPIGPATVMMIVHDPPSTPTGAIAQRPASASSRQPRAMASVDSIESMPEFSQYFEVVPER